MTFDDPDDDIFGHLDDPAPPSLGSEALTHVMARGGQIRRRRRTIYAATSAAVVIVIAGSAITLAAGQHPHGQTSTLTSPTSSPTPHGSHSAKAGKKDHKKSSPDSLTETTGVGVGRGTTTKKHHHHHPAQGGGGTPGPCVTTTTTTTPAPPPPDPTTSGSAPSQPNASVTPVVTVVTTCPTPTTPTTPTSIATPPPSGAGNGD
jgi:hypothetical protein